MLAMISLFTSHYIADWLLQSVNMSRQKSNKFTVLCQHVSIIFTCLFLTGCIFLDPILSLKLSLVNALTHAIIDWYIWRTYKATVKLRNRNSTDEELRENFQYWLDPIFAAFLGLDYILHVIFIYVIYQPFL